MPARAATIHHALERSNYHRILSANFGDLCRRDRRRNHHHSRRFAFVSVKRHANYLHTVPLRRWNVIANDIVFVKRADPPLRTRISQCDLTSVAPSVVSESQIRRRSQ